MKIAGIIIALFLIASTVWAAPASQFTGQQYMNMPASERSIAVKTYISMAKQKNIIIRKSPEYYCKQLDASFEKNASLRKENFNRVLKTLIIMEYDWDQKGIDKESLARKYLGQEQYQANKKRLGRK